MPGAYRPPTAGMGGGDEAGWQQRVDTQMSKEELVSFAMKELERDAKESAARLLLDACRIDPSDRELRKLFWDNFTVSDIRYWNLQVPPVPLWADLADTFGYPVRGMEWLGIVLGAVVLGPLYYMCANSMHPLSLIGVLIVLAWMANLIAKHTKWAAAGRAGLPGMVEFSFSDLWYVFMAWLAAYLPLILFGALMIYRIFSGGPPGPGAIALILVASLALMILGALIYPMAQLIALLFNSGKMAFDYPFLIDAIRIVWKDYLFAWLLFIAVGVVQLGVQMLTNLHLTSWTVFFLWLFFSFVGWCLQLYGLVLSSHIMGRVYYNNERRLGWFAEGRGAPPMGAVGYATLGGAALVALAFIIVIFRGTPHDEAVDNCRQAMVAMQMMDSEKAIERAKEALAIEPEYAGAHFILAKAYENKQDPDSALQHYQAALDIYPGYYEVYQHRAMLYYLLNEEGMAQNDQNAHAALVSEFQNDPQKMTMMMAGYERNPVGIFGPPEEE